MCTQSEWDFLTDPKKSLDSKMTKLIERANLRGCTDPGEQCFKWMLSVLLMCHYDTLPGPWPIYYKLQDLKQAAAAEKKPYPLEQITQYPSNPEDLPEKIYSYAYTDSQPITVEMAGINISVRRSL